jgi:hypothetical protein
MYFSKKANKMCVEKERIMKKKYRNKEIESPHAKIDSN